MQIQNPKIWAEALFNDVWQSLDVNKVKAYYHQDIQGQINSAKIGFDDIINRVNFITSRHKTFRNEIMDVVAEGNKIVVHCEQHYGEQNETQSILCLYTLENNKIKNIVACTNNNENYFEQD